MAIGCFTYEYDPVTSYRAAHLNDAVRLPLPSTAMLRAVYCLAALNAAFGFGFGFALAPTSTLALALAFFRRMSAINVSPAATGFRACISLLIWAISSQAVRFA